MALVKINDYSHGVVLIGNDLLSGRSVYLSGTQSWLNFDEFQLDQAAIAHNVQSADALLAAVKSQGAHSPVIDPYLIELNEKGLPSHARESLRSTGPSIVFGEQTGFGGNDVSV